MNDLTGRQLGDYQVLRRLGRGAMAGVYLAEQVSLERRVALKVLNADLASDTTYVNRFQHEARAAAALVHANIVQIYEVGCVNGLHFIAQEYVAGKNLGEVMQQRGRLDPGLALDILRQVASALHKAYEGGIVHRDIKPENMMLARSGEVKVADFGLARVERPTAAKLTQVGVTMGTPLYMSPEQIEGREVDIRSDIYSLGVSAYHLLTGEPPFQGDTPLSVAVQHLNSKPTPLADERPDLPVRFAQIVEKMMAKKPERRYATPGELLVDLRELAKQAADEGWAEGPENWSVLDLMPAYDHGYRATTELDTLMKEASRMAGLGRAGRRVALVALACGALGAAIGLATSPQHLLADARRGPARKGDVRTQLLHAKRVDIEPAWRAVWEYFPGADPYYKFLARQGLARLHLAQGHFDLAIDQCEWILENAGDNDEQFRRFAVAGLTVARLEQGQEEAARQALAQFDGNTDQLRQADRLMWRMFTDAQARLSRQGAPDDS